MIIVKKSNVTMLYRFVKWLNDSLSFCASPVVHSDTNQLSAVIGKIGRVDIKYSGNDEKLFVPRSDLTFHGALGA